MEKRTFDEAREYGYTAERLASELLMERAWGVNPTYEYSGAANDKAPKLRFLHRSYVLPDLDCAKGGKRIWAEVKHYALAPVNRRLGCQVHGIKRRHRQHYLSIQKETGSPVFLLVAEDEASVLLSARLDRLVPYPCQCGPCSAMTLKHGSAKWIEMDGRDFFGCRLTKSNVDMVYFRRDAMKVMAQDIAKRLAAVGAMPGPRS